jgi:hypothetical protein
LRYALFALALASSILGGCEDPTVGVRVELPDGYEVATISVTVLETEEPCDRFAFGEIPAEAITLAKVAEVALEVGGAAVPIAGVPRVADKRWLAEGRDDDGRLVVAGCQEQGEIVGDAVVTIVTEPSADITLADSAHVADQPVPESMEVVVDDGAGVALADRAITWDVYGPNGEQTEGDVESGADGHAELPLVPTSQYGPASIQIRARWARTQPLVVPAFRRAEVGVGLSINAACTGDPDEVLAVDTRAWTPFKIGNQAALAGLAADETRAFLYVATRSAAGTGAVCSPDLGRITNLAVLRNNDVEPDRLLVLTPTVWTEYRVTTPGGTPVIGLFDAHGWDNDTADAPVATLVLRSCDADSDADRVLVQTTADTVHAFDVDGAPLPLDPVAAAIQTELAGATGPTPRLIRAGCNAQGDGEARLPAVILETPRDVDETPVRNLVIDLGDGEAVALDVPSFGEIAFSPFAAGDDPYLLGGLLEPSGAKVVRWRLTTGTTGALELREDVRDDSLGPPASIGFGYLDGDDKLDTVWGLGDDVQGGTPDSRLQMSLGCGAGELALNGFSPALATSSAAVFLAPAGTFTSDLVIGGSRFVLFIDTSP